MKLKLFHQLLLSYLTVVIVVLAVLGIVLSWLLSSFIYREQEQRLAESGRSVAQMISDSDGRLQLRGALNTVDQAVGARIWIINTAGNITMDSRGMMNQRNIRFSIPEDLLGGREVSEVLVVEDLDSTMLLVGIPIFEGEQVSGGVLMLTPVSDVQATLGSIYRLFWPAAGLSLIIAALIALTVSRSISRSLADLSKASVALAKGDFNQTVPVSGAAELRAVALSFNQMAGQLRQLETMRRDFIASVSHELRTPMTSIRGFVQGVLDGKIPRPKQQRYLELTLAEIRRLSALVADLLDLSALEGKETPLELKELDLREVVNLSLAAMEPQLTAHGTDVDVQLPNRPALIRGEPQRLQQVLINLVDNSIRHAKPGGKLRIHLVLEGSHYHLTVADNGPGIAPEDWENIFKPFFRGDGKGSGLGLAIARALIAAHGGSIHVREATGGGALFVILLPRHS